MEKYLFFKFNYVVNDYGKDILYLQESHHAERYLTDDERNQYILDTFHVQHGQAIENKSSESLSIGHL